MGMDVNAADVGQHWLILQKLPIPKEDTKEMLDRFVNTFANIYAGDGTTTFVGVIKQGEEEDDQDESRRY